MKNFSATKYSLQNVTTGRIFEDEGWLLDDPEGGSPSLIRARYTTRQIEPGGDEMGIYRFAQWLPVGRMLKGSCAPVTYKKFETGRCTRTEKPLYHLQRLLSQDRRPHEHLLVQGDRGLTRFADASAKTMHTKCW